MVISIPFHNFSSDRKSLEHNLWKQRILMVKKTWLPFFILWDHARQSVVEKFASSISDKMCKNTNISFPSLTEQWKIWRRLQSPGYILVGKSRYRAISGLVTRYCVYSSRQTSALSSIQSSKWIFLWTNTAKATTGQSGSYPASFTVIYSALSYIVQYRNNEQLYIYWNFLEIYRNL